MGMIGVAGLIAIAAVGGFAAGTASMLAPAPAVVNQATIIQGNATAVAANTLAIGGAISQCYAVDGDTLRCGAERIRLIGIDSPEMPGHCLTGRNCVEGDPFAAKDALAGAVGATMAIRRFGVDHYGRTLALVTGPLGDLSCSQLRAGHAIYRSDWDVKGAMMKGCS